MRYDNTMQPSPEHKAGRFIRNPHTFVMAVEPDRGTAEADISGASDRSVREIGIVASYGQHLSFFFRGESSTV
jgi:hypothetical protein